MHQTRRFQTSTLALALLLAGAGVAACVQDRQERMKPQPTAQSAGPSSAKRDLSDANIVALLAIANQVDIEGGQLAQQKANSPQVRSYGTRMVADHTSMLQEGNQVAKQLMVNPVQPELGQQMIREHQRAMDALSAKSGEEFDRAYIDHEIKTHEKVIRLVKEAMNDADTPQLRQLLLRSRPVLEDHLQQAQNVKQFLHASR